jgi:hypothetical protein
MKKLNLILFLFLSCFLFSCQPKKEKKQPVIFNNHQNYKYDDDEIAKRNTKNSKDKKQNLDEKKSDKVH